MAHLTAILDACVLYPAPLRSFLMYLSMEGLFHARWTDAIHEEWMRNVRKDFPDIGLRQVERIRDLMNAHVPDCLVTDYESLIPSLSLPDPNDRHVLAAAIRSGAGVIVTANLVDFPTHELGKFGIEAQHPDRFVMSLLGISPVIVCEAARQHRQSLKNPPMTVDGYLATLERQSLPRTVGVLRQFADLI